MGYVESKIAHMKRVGLVAANSTGYGEHGGACPDWLKQVQKERREAEEAQEEMRCRAGVPAQQSGCKRNPRFGPDGLHATRYHRRSGHTCPRGTGTARNDRRQ